MKRFILRSVQVLCLLLIAVKAGAQSSSASYPAGCWWAADDKDQFLLTMHIWRSTDEQNSCGDLTITDKDTDKELYSGTITYQYRELVNDVPTGVYYFNVVSDKGKQSRIAIRPWKQGREEIVVKSEGELKDHPLLKQKFYGIFLEVDEQPTMFLNTESELLAYLRESIANREEVGGAWGINPMLYVNAHARLNHELPIYAKPKGAGAVNIRDKASTTAAKVAELKPGETLLVVDEFEGWCQVKLGENKTGWVSLSVVTLTNTKGRTPAATTSFILGNGKLGPLSIGQTVESIPKSVPGLYDSFKYTKEEVEGNDMEDGYIAETCSFYKGGKNIFNAGASNKVLSSFVLLKGSEFIKTNEGIQVGYNARQLFQKKHMQWSTYFEGEVFATSGHFTYYVPDDGILGVDIPDKVSHFKVNAVVTRITYSEEQ